MSSVVISRVVGGGVGGAIVLVLILLRRIPSAGGCDQGRQSVILAGVFFGAWYQKIFVFPPFLLSLYPLVLVRLFVCFFVCC